VYTVLYPFLRLGLWIVLAVLPVEAFNRLCLILPGRLIAYGLRYYGAQIGEGAIFTPPIAFHNFADRSKQPFSNLTVGRDCYLGREIFLDLKEKVVIEDRATLAMGVTIVTHTDLAQSPLKANLFPSTQAPVFIRKGAYLAARATILQGVEIGECALIAAGAVVNKSVPKYAVYGGVPAREIKILQDSQCG
jgi:acetyltransferase-like isoleucine patch superfamily enzyme